MHMKRSHQARKHRNRHDRTDGGNFDKPSTNGDSKALPKKSTTVKVGLSADGKASVYVVAAGDSDLSSGASSRNGVERSFSGKGRHRATKARVRHRVRRDRAGRRQRGPRDGDQHPARQLAVVIGVRHHPGERGCELGGCEHAG